MSLRIHLVVAACVLFAAVPATAQELNPSATRAVLRDAQLEAFVAEALDKAPEMASAHASVEAAQKRIEPARTLADPFLSTSYQNDGGSISFGEESGSFLGLMASQAIPWPGKRRLAGDIAASQVRELERGALSRTALTLEARVRNAWYDVILARSIDGIIDDRRAAASQIEESVRERYAAGLAVQQDVLRAQLELARLDELKALQAATITSRIAELNGLVGAAQDRVIRTPEVLPTDAEVPPLTDLIAAAAARSPEAAATQQAIDTVSLTVDLAKKNFFPDFTVNAGSMYRGSFEMGPMWQVGVGINIPLWIKGRQQNQLAEAHAVVRGRTADRDTVLRELELRTRERMAQLEAALRIARLYREMVLPLDEVSLESALASYQAGKLPFITVLDALNTLYSDRALYQTRLAESAKWRVAIDEASLQPSAMSGAPSMGSSSSGMQSGGATTAAPSSGSSNSYMNSMR